MTIELEFKKSFMKIWIWMLEVKLNNKRLGVVLVLEFEAKVKTEEIRIRSWKPNQDGWIKYDEIQIRSWN